MLTLICGLSRAGKTTYSRQFKDVPVIHVDKCGLQSHVFAAVANRGDADVVVDGIFWQAKDRMKLISAYNGYGATCIWLDTPKEIRQTREHYREYTDHYFEPPSFAEGWDEIIIIRGEYVERSCRQT